MSAGLLGGLWSAILSNWVTIVVTAAGTLASTVGSQRLVRKYQSSIRDERIDQAKNDFIDILERQMINHDELPMERLDDLVVAVGRKHSVDLKSSLGNINLLQDLQLRFEESRHLEPEEKQAYSEQIGEHIQAVRKKRQEPEVTQSREEILSEIEQHLESEERKEKVQQLKEEIEELEERNQPEAYDTEWSASIGMATTLILIGIFVLIVEKLPLAFGLLDSNIGLISSVVAATLTLYTFLKSSY